MSFMRTLLKNVGARPAEDVPVAKSGRAAVLWSRRLVRSARKPMGGRDVARETDAEVHAFAGDDLDTKKTLVPAFLACHYLADLLASGELEFLPGEESVRELVTMYAGVALVAKANLGERRDHTTPEGCEDFMAYLKDFTAEDEVKPRNRLAFSRPELDFAKLSMYEIVALCDLPHNFDATRAKEMIPSLERFSEADLLRCLSWTLH